MSTLYVVGIGPGGREHMTKRAIEVLESCQVIVGYSGYMSYVEPFLSEKIIYTTGMTGEIDRCKKAIEYAREGKDTAVVSTGDAGIYGMAGPIIEMAEGIEVVVIPGVSSSISASADLGCPIMNDFVTISLSDLLTPWEVIIKRIELAAQADFVMAIYNPRSKGRPDHLKQAIELILQHQKASTPVGIVRNSGRPDTNKMITTLEKINYDDVDMKSMVIIGNSKTYIKAGKMITPRGYENK